MKNTSTAEAERIREAFEELREKFSELTNLIKDKLEPHERDQFKYNTLGPCETSLFEETDWVTQYSSIHSLEKWVMDIEDQSGEIEDEEDEDEEGD